MNDPIIELKNLTKYYRSFAAVDDLNLTIHKGEIFGLLGPNGAGKTTSILMMLGLTEPSSGTAYVLGFDATRQPIEVKKRVGYLPDSVGFYDHLTGFENLVLIGKLNGLSDDESQSVARQLMDTVGLQREMNKKTGSYSRGMKQRLGLADVLIKNPDVIILDEPTLGIDPSGVKDFLTLIKQLSRQQGLTVLLSSHHLHQVQQVCDRVGIFVGGKLLIEGNIESLSSKLFDQEGYLTTIVTQTSGDQLSVLAEELRKQPDVKSISLLDQTVEIACDQDITPDLVRFFVERGVDVVGVRKKDYGLDEIYQKYFENKVSDQATHEKSFGFFQKSIFKKNTIVILWGDHGYLLGDMGMWTKHVNYELANRVPLVISYPKEILSGHASASIVETVDIYPTLIHLANLKLPTNNPIPFDGESLVPLLTKKEHKIDYAYHCYPRDGWMGRAIRTDNFRLVEWTNINNKNLSPQYEFYSYGPDLLEYENQADINNKDFQETLKLLKLQPEYHHPLPPSPAKTVEALDD